MYLWRGPFALWTRVSDGYALLWYRMLACKVGTSVNRVEGKVSGSGSNATLLPQPDPNSSRARKVYGVLCTHPVQRCLRWDVGAALLPPPPFFFFRFLFFFLFFFRSLLFSPSALQRVRRFEPTPPEFTLSIPRLSIPMEVVPPLFRVLLHSLLFRRTRGQIYNRDDDWFSGSRQ